MRPRLTYANVMATIAVFIALGGASYAALKLPKNSVGTKQIKKEAVTPPKLSKAAVTMFKGARGDTGPQGPPGPPGSPGTDATASTELIEKATAIDENTPKELTVECPNGPVLSGGFVLYGQESQKLRAVRSYALPGDKVWLVRALADEPGEWQLSVIAVCVK